MPDFFARQVVEALRSGVPSRTVGEYFSDARPEMQEKIVSRLEKVRESGLPDGMIFTGQYGEGKTHLLNSIFSLASTSNMVVSFVSLGKESPIDKPELLYGKLVAATFLPGARQPGFRTKLLEELTPGSGLTGELLAYAAKELETDKLYYLIKALVNAQEEEDRELLLADLEGDFASDAVIKRTYRRIIGKPAKFNMPFSKRKHIFDYYDFMSHLFRLFGYSGWVLLFDELELMGRFGKKARAKAYCEMQHFLSPDPRLEQTFSLFALSSSYLDDVIEKKNDHQVIADVFSDSEEKMRLAGRTISEILRAPELMPLKQEEIAAVLISIQDFHGRAYDWTPQLSAESLLKETAGSGHLLRTRIRAAIEFLDQLYQYGSAGRTTITALGKESYDEDDDHPDLEELLE